MTTSLPAWVWDLLADLIDEEAIHPKLYFTSGAFEGYRQYDWCAQTVLTRRVPPEILTIATHIADYRQGAESTHEAQP